MGCDIHMYRERFKDGFWETDTVVEVEAEPTEDSDGYKSFESGMGYIGRDYWVFGALSNVRAYNEDWPVKPPAEDRDFPTDACAVHVECSEQWDCDAHSHGYLTMTELKSLQEQYENAMVLDGSNPEKWLRISQSLTCLIEKAEQGDYFKGLLDDNCRILFFYDN